MREACLPAQWRASLLESPASEVLDLMEEIALGSRVRLARPLS